MRRFTQFFLTVGVGFLSTQCVEGADLGGPLQGGGGSGATEAGVPEGGGEAATTGGAGSGGAPMTGGAPAGGAPGTGGTPGIGGAPVTGGAPSTGGATGTGATGGGGGPVGTVPVGSITARITNQTEADCTTGGSSLQLTFEISASSWISNLAGLTVEYWYTPEIVNPVVEIYDSTVRDTTTVAALDDRIEIQFSGGTTAVTGSVTFKIQTAFHATDYQTNSDPTNDWSCGDATRVTVHHNGQLISGTPPG